jgi:hypothetical protein
VDVLRDNGKKDVAAVASAASSSAVRVSPIEQFMKTNVGG